MPDKRNKAILVVSFGTSYEETRTKNIEAIEKRIGDKYQDYKIYRAFTSKMIIKKLKEVDGIEIPTVEEALEVISKDGMTELIVQPTHIIHGIENDNMIEAIKMYEDRFQSVMIGTPLLSETLDYEEVIDIIMNHFKGLKCEEALVLMGHGSSHYSNSSYPALDYMFKEKGYPNVYVGTVEGYPSLHHVIGIMKSKNIKKIYLTPLMVVAGDHAMNDMAGEEEDSWKVIMEEEGYEVEIVMKGLGEYKEIQEMFIKHIEKAKNTKQGV
jgi:sirohydrochlorin cobaltochelatase